MTTERSRYVRRLLPLAMLVIVAGIQIVRVNILDVPQTRWRGGGFGMYTEMHPNHTEIWLYERGEQPHQLDRAHLPYTPTKPLPRCKDPAERLRELRALATPDSLDKFWRDCLSKTHGHRLTRVEIWRRRLDIAGGRLVRERILVDDNPKVIRRFDDPRLIETQRR